MTPAQTKFYWREWAATWRSLRAVRPELKSADATRERHDIHRRALGYPCSMLDLNNAEFDAVLAEFRAISRPTDMSTQRRQLNQPRIRLLWKIEHEAFAELTTVIGDDQSATQYLVALLSDRFQTNDVGTLNDRQLRELLITLGERVKRLRAVRGTSMEMAA